MAIDERSRLDLYRRLEEVLGVEEADTLMSHLPPGGWSEVSTKHDLEQTRALMKADLDLFRTEMRGEFDGFRSEMRTEVAELRSEMRTEFANVRAEMAVQSRQTVLALVPVIVAVNGVAVALAAVLG